MNMRSRWVPAGQASIVQRHGYRVENIVYSYRRRTRRGRDVHRNRFRSAEHHIISNDGGLCAGSKKCKKKNTPEQSAFLNFHKLPNAESFPNRPIPWTEYTGRARFRAGMTPLANDQIHRPVLFVVRVRC